MIRVDGNISSPFFCLSEIECVVEPPDKEIAVADLYALRLSLAELNIAGCFMVLMLAKIVCPVMTVTSLVS